MRLALIQQSQTARDEQASSLKRFGDTLNQTLATLTEYAAPSRSFAAKVKTVCA